MVKAVHRGFGDNAKLRRLTDPASMTLDLLNTKSIGFDIVSKTTTVCPGKSNP